MKSLLSSDAVEKELAIRAVLLALPESGPQLVAAVRTGSGDQKTRAAAGVYNSAMVLQAMPAAQLQAKQNAVAQFTEIASTHDPRTLALVQQIHQKSDAAR